MQTTKEKGKNAEDIACIFLEKKGFEILDRNYYKKWGEIDIVAKAANDPEDPIHFFEVKGTYTTRDPSERVHVRKIVRLQKIIRTYLAEYYDHNQVFLFHVLCVYMNKKTRIARVKWIYNVIL
jgi:putative endonuclease